MRKSWSGATAPIWVKGQCHMNTTHIYMSRQSDLERELKRGARRAVRDACEINNLDDWEALGEFDQLLLRSHEQPRDFGGGAWPSERRERLRDTLREILYPEEGADNLILVAETFERCMRGLKHEKQHRLNLDAEDRNTMFFSEAAPITALDPDSVICELPEYHSQEHGTIIRGIRERGEDDWRPVWWFL